ncbi:alpha/beta fold hydrolase [Yoonia sp. GPGPB17]|uniref:alpha/beta fold hydrolase n=1 Tax=Yoonia sp. GPGPB17 TaxID=3026147 RepID=UPI0030BB5C67
MNEPLLLLPGMMCDARLYSPQIEAFSYERTILTAPLNEHDSVEALARDILDTAPQQFALAGLSMGGIVAMEVFRQAPDRVTRLALLDTNPKAEAAAIAERREPQMQKVRDGHLRAVMRDEMKPHYLTDGPHTGRILDLCMAMAETLGPDAFINQSRALQSRPDQQKTLKKVTVPTLILCGEDDALCPIHRHELMHDLIPGSTLTIIKSAGHLPTLEQPQATNEALAQWLNQ